MRRSVVRWSWRYIPKNVCVYVSRERYVLLWVDRGGRVYGGTCVPFLAVDGQQQKEQLMARIWEGPMKRKDVETMLGVRVHASPGGLKESYPNLAEWMTCAVFEGNGKLESRESPTMTVWCAGGQWRASLKDRAEKLVMWLSAESWLELMQMIELFVLEADAPWRNDEGDRQGKRVK